MSKLFEGIGVALIILAFCVGMKGCMDENREKPLIGQDGLLWATK